LGCVAAQSLGLGAFDSTNSAQIIKPSPGICAVVGGAGFTEVCRIGWRLSQPSPKAVLHLLRSPSGQVRVGNQRRSRALAQSGCRGGSFFLWMRVQDSDTFPYYFLSSALMCR